MADVADKVRVSVHDRVSGSYNIASCNELLVNEVLLHVAYLNKLLKKLDQMQETKILKRSRMQVKLDSDHDTKKFEDYAAKLLKKLEECSTMSNQWFTDKYERKERGQKLDVFYHSELAEDALDTLAKTNAPDSDHNGQNYQNSLKIARQADHPPANTEQAAVKDELKGKASAQLYSHIAKKRGETEEAEERRLVSEVFHLLQQKAFISDRYVASLSDYDKLELMLRVCERYQ